MALAWSLNMYRGVFSGGRAMGAKPPLDQKKLLILGGFQDPAGADCWAPLGQIPETAPAHVVCIRMHA